MKSWWPLTDSGRGELLRLGSPGGAQGCLFLFRQAVREEAGSFSECFPRMLVIMEVGPAVVRLEAQVAAASRGSWGGSYSRVV